MKKLLAAGAVAGLVLLGGGAMPASAAPPADLVCPGLSSGKIDAQVGEDDTITLTAPDGFLISSVCLKSGPGFEIIPVNPPLAEVTVSTTSGKDISHFSYTLVPDVYTPPPYS